MALFPKENEIGALALNDAPARMRWMREQGTKRLLIFLIGLAVIWFVVSQIQNRFLLAKQWPPLQPKMDGLTVIGALNPRTDYDHNLFKILTENRSSRLVLTEYGRNSIFDPRNGPLCSDQVSNLIDHVLRIRNLTGYAMLEPYLRAAVASQMGDRDAYKRISKETPVEVPTDDSGVAVTHTTLGALIDQYSKGGGDNANEGGEENTGGEGSASGKSVEQVVTLPATTVAKSLPVVLTEAQFNDAWLEEQPANLLTPQAWTVHLGLTPEGRSRFFQWSHNHEHESLVFVLKGTVVMASRMAQTLDVNEVEVTNITDKEAGQSVVDYVKKHISHPS